MVRDEMGKHFRLQFRGKKMVYIDETKYIYILNKIYISLSTLILLLCVKNLLFLKQ